MNENLGKLVTDLQGTVDAVAGSVKEKLEAVVGEETVKKVTDILNTDVGVVAKDSVEQAGTVLADMQDKATDALENALKRDLDGDGDIGGTPKA
ncbi:MAG: hypothetical protein ACOYME_07290 [Prochlorotrichaceae cyanobacterium]|jgi:hypothetical protein